MGRKSTPRKSTRKEKTKELNIAIVIPTGGNPKIEFIHSLQQISKMFRDGGIEYNINWIKSSVIHANREHAVIDVLKNPDVTHVLFMDDDMEIAPRAVVELFRTGKDFVGVTYRKRQMKMDWTSLGEDGMKIQADGVREDCIPCVTMGFGLTLISRKVLDAIEVPRFEPFWDKDVSDYRGEDESLCYLARGIDIIPHISLAASNHVGHVGETVYSWQSHYEGIANGCVERQAAPETA